MNIDLQEFFDACDPSKTLMMGRIGDRRYYIDFSSVRGGKIIEALKRTIIRLSPNKPTCQLFTGHIGCGKSTELSRLQSELEGDGFYVIYFESTQDLDENDVDITDILLAIARQVSETLEQQKIELQPKGFKSFLNEIWDFLQTPVIVSGEAEVLGAGVKASTEGEFEVSLPVGIGKITARAMDSPKLRSQLRQYLEPQTNRILQFINDEVLSVAISQLKHRGYKGLVVIIDNLDRVENREISTSGRLLPEYLFVDRGEQLRKLNCHLVYTLPLSLVFSNDCETLKNRLGGGLDPKVLPMVPVCNRDGTVCTSGMELLRQMVLARAFPDVFPQHRLELVTQIFEEPASLDRLCWVSGGHARNLLGILYRCIQEEDPPISNIVLERAIREARDRLLLAVDDHEWELLFQVVQEQNLKGEREYQTLLRSLFVFEYQDHRGRWFGLNPLLAETQRFKQWQAQEASRI
ncbi:MULTISPECIES: P-loop NTPase fold protein [unclassified Roseofilum]|uniref:P-loop NTPase fold protein n=1 Tax=unclassified Roseofilum TaxID=2620099 RepID=UPI001AFECF2E|nr:MULTISPECIES: P-loop NTPase fold protein [unclassified Roseofilum]MBP0007817.1 ATP-binding protein [Roseofilum sp. Belize Diploria]MBP0032547.1 ATP-binding protein [Roseofilum sp. Belize BBD 4]MBP0041729.1 ATP-binding protein [Roseofilum sp. SBFL]